jgi:hypothetical protein
MVLGLLTKERFLTNTTTKQCIVTQFINNFHGQLFQGFSYLFFKFNIDTVTRNFEQLT